MSLRWILIGLVIVAAVVGVLFWGNSTGVPVDVVVAETGLIREYIEERATTRVPEIHDITMPLDGRIRRIALKEGDEVRAGDIVAQMDPADLETDLQAAVTRTGQFQQVIVSVIQSIKAALEQSKAAEAKFQFADAEYKRKSTLFERKAISESELDEAKLLRLESQVDHRADLLNLRALEAVRTAIELSQQDAQEQEKRERRDRNRATIYSPVDGTVLSRAVTNERMMRAGETLLEIGSLSDLEVEAEILSQEAVKVKVGQAVDIEGASIGSAPISGEVTRIYPQGFTKVSSLGVEQQRVLVIIRFDTHGLDQLRQSGRELGIDYRVRVKIYTAQKEDALTVPRSALFRSADGHWQTFVVRGGVAKLADLELGHSNDFTAEVRSGIAAGDQVILAPESTLTNGQRVEPQLFSSN